MSLTISDLLAKKCNLVADLFGNPVQLEYRPHVITPQRMAELGKLTVKDSLVKQICMIVSSWDIELEAGKPLPITKDALEKVPVDVLTAILKAINDDVVPDEDAKNA